MVSNISSEEAGSNTDGDVDAARKYHVLMELGRGGTAVVIAGIARGIGGFTKLVVLKNIEAGVPLRRETVRMFVNEARLSARMNHPNVVQVYEVFRQNRLPVIVMEYLDGQSLARSRAGSRTGSLDGDGDRDPVPTLAGCTTPTRSSTTTASRSSSCTATCRRTT